jgi:uncharacterized membrane protein
MGAVASPVRKGAVILAVIMAPIGIHVAMATQRGLALAGVMVIGESGLIAWIALSFVPVHSLRWIGCAVVLALTTAIWWLSPGGVDVSSAIPHALAYLSLLTVFGASLAPGRKPIITVLAEASRGTLPPAVLRYTRRVTWAWCLFCAGQLTVSLLLLLFAPVTVWSAFVNLCNLPLLAAMFCGEFVWRKWRHGSWPQERLTDGFRLAREVRTGSTHDAVR